MKTTLQKNHEKGRDEAILHIFPKDITEGLDFLNESINYFEAMSDILPHKEAAEKHLKKLRSAATIINNMSQSDYVKVHTKD